MEKNLQDYVQAIRKKLWLIGLFVGLSCATTFYVSQVLYTPVYSATAQLIVNTTSKGLDAVTYSDVNMNLSLVESYKQILKSDRILESVALARPDLQIDVPELKRAVKVASPEKTQILTITMEDQNYTRAAEVVNAVSQQFIADIPALMNLNNVTVLRLADPGQKPEAAPSGMAVNMAVSLMVSLMASAGAVILMENMNQTLRTQKELELEIGLPLLASIGVIGKSDREPVKTYPIKAGETYVALK